MNNDNNIVAVYIRVSTDRQTEYSPDEQLNQIKKFAKTNGYEIDPKYIYKDEGISGRKAEKRPAFMEMISTAKTKPKSPFSKILVHKLDRFSRNREDSVVYKSLLKKECNVDVISITENFGDDKFSIILESMLEAMAEYYSLNLSDEVMKGMIPRAEKGLVNAKPPFGYKMINSNYVIEEKEAETVRYIFNEFEKGVSFKNIAIALNNLGFTTKKGNLFEVRTVEYILRNPAYKGYLLWTPNLGFHTGSIKIRLEKGILRKGNYEPIITEEQFDNVNKIIDEQKKKYKYSTKKTTKANWLKRLVRCSSCGGILTTVNGGLQCTNYLKGWCKESHYIASKEIRRAIIEQLKKDYDYPCNINITKKLTNNTSDLDLLINNSNKINEKLERAKRLYLEGIDTIEEYKENKLKLENEKKYIENEIIKIKEHEKNLAQEEQFSIKAKSTYELMVDENIPEDVKFTVIHDLIENIIFDRKEMSLKIQYKL